MNKTRRRRVLFVCVRNSARSQMAEAWTKRLCSARLDAESAGLEAGVLNPCTVEVLMEVGIDISQKKTRSIEDVLRSGQSYDYVITVCDSLNAERCPNFPGEGIRYHWNLPDPAEFSGTHAEQLQNFRETRDAVRICVESWCSWVCPADSGTPGA